MTPRLPENLLAPDELRAAGSFLAPGGNIVVFVPALPSLYGTMDEVSGHHRRYRRAELSAVFAAAGWRPGQPFPGAEVLLAASGATFLAVVLAQAGNAFACRSSTRWPGSLGWTSNRLLIPAIAAGLAFCAATFLIAPVAAALGQSWPTWPGWLMAGLAPLLLLAVDAVQRRKGGGYCVRSVRCARSDSGACGRAGRSGASSRPRRW